MLLIPYFAEVEVTPDTPDKKAALVHPGGSQTGSLYFRGFDIVRGPVGSVPLKLHRYATKVTDGVLSSSYSFLDGAPSSFAEVRSGGSGWPNDAATFSTTAFAETRGTGGGIIVPTANASGGALVIGPNSSLVFETLDPDTRGEMYTLRLFWGEQRPGLPHAPSAVLPPASAFSSANHFNVPFGWTSVTFLVTYTAHASASPGGRPAWRGVMSDGANDYPMTITDMAIDASGQRLAFPMSDRWYTTVAAGATIRFAVSFDIPPGITKVRLDLAEIGDTTNRGTASVTVTGR